MKDLLKKQPLFNGSTTVHSPHRFIGAECTNLINLQEPTFKWAVTIARQMLVNYWLPQEISTVEDLSQWSRLNKNEIRAYKTILSYLIFLDSLQSKQLPYLSSFITSPELQRALVIHAQQEVIHSESYQYLIESAIPPKESEGIYEYYQRDPVLLRRIQTTVRPFNDFWEEPTHENLIKALFADYFLEGLFFYNSFKFFDAIFEYRGILKDTRDMIKLIRRDENTHCALFKHIIREARTEEDRFVLKDPRYLEIYYAMLREAVETEIGFSIHACKSIKGINAQSIQDYTWFLANHRTQALGIDPIYPKVANPYKHLEGEDLGNFFETSGKEYLSQQVFKKDDIDF